MITQTSFFNSKTNVILNKDDVSEMQQNASSQIINKIGNWLSEGSGWRIFSVDGHYVNLVQYTPLMDQHILHYWKNLEMLRKD